MGREFSQDGDSCEERGGTFAQRSLSGYVPPEQHVGPQSLGHDGIEGAR